LQEEEEEEEEEGGERVEQEAGEMTRGMQRRRYGFVVWA
jgi:hypothetical protein